MKQKLIFLFVVIGQSLTAQTFTESPQTPPFEGVSSGSIATADVDGDNDQDILITGNNGSSDRLAILYSNDGLGNYTEVIGTPFDSVSSSAVAFADIDGDNDQDVLITGLNSPSTRISKLYINDGTGSYTEVSSTPFDGVYRSFIAFADVDGDNDKDVLITGRNNSSEAISKLYTNNGSGSYTEVSGTPFVGVSLGSVAFADIDGDNDQDLLIAGRNNSSEPVSKLYINDGSGSYTEVLGTPFDGVDDSSVAFADVDGDNDQDVLVTGQNNSSERISKLYINDGNGIYTEAPGTPFLGLGFGSIAFADVDGDNDQDVLITGSTTEWPETPMSKLYVNDGAGGYAELTGTPFEDVAYSSVAFADVDGDNDQDVFITGYTLSSTNHVSKLYINGGSGTSIEQVRSNEKLELTTYPNPSSSELLFIEYNSKQSGNMTIKVYTADGSLLSLQQLTTGAGNQRLSIDVRDLNKGSYFVEMEIGDNRGVARFVIQ